MLHTPTGFCSLILVVTIPLTSLAQRADDPPEYVPCVCADGPQHHTIYNELSGELTLEFCEFEDDPQQQQQAFYDFMWQSFIALNWPRDEDGIRGQPDLSKSILSIAGPGNLPVTVWETYREPNLTRKDPSRSRRQKPSLKIISRSDARSLSENSI